MTANQCPVQQNGVGSNPLEESICPHLRTKRTLPKSTPSNYTPPFPAFSSRFTADQNEFVMIVIGVQSHQGMLADDSLEEVVQMMANKESIQHWDLCSFRDYFDQENRCLLGYFSSRTQFVQWKQEVQLDNWWKEKVKNAKDDVEHGWYFEQFSPSIERLETVFSNTKAQEGFSKMERKRSGPIEEHAYWGSMRDRLPKAQTDPLQSLSSNKPILHRPIKNEIMQGLIKIQPKQNLCVIRSGQDFHSLEGEERRSYLQQIHPTLQKGMTFLRDKGDEVNCFDCRFMNHINPIDLAFDSIEKTFGLAYFQDLQDLENWAKHHPTHLAIFSKFLHYADELKGNVNLRLFHDVMVLSTDQQEFQYVNCHAATGMMAAR